MPGRVERNHSRPPPLAGKKAFSTASLLAFVDSYPTNVFKKREEIQMQIRDVMSRECKWCTPTAKVTEVARLMAENDFGSVPIAENDKLVGMVTDRDIVIRGLAKGKDLHRTSTREVMSPNLYYCFDDQSCDEVAENMADIQVRRLPVVTRDKKLVGIVSLGDLARKARSNEAEMALKGVSKAS
jgi:CBS domain-containing protein